MRVLQQLLIPGVQHTKEAEFGAEMTGISRHLQQCLGAGTKQQPVDLALVLQGDRRQGIRQGKDHMDVPGRQQVATSRRQPAVTRVGLALGTVPVAARVEGDGTIAAAGTSIDMASEGRCSTGQNGVEHFQMPPGQPLVAAIEESVSRGADDIGHLQQWPGHLCNAGWVSRVDAGLKEQHFRRF